MSNMDVLNDIVDNQVKPAMDRLKQALMRANRSCPECDGTNLNSTHTKCWDCSATDYCS